MEALAVSIGSVVAKWIFRLWANDSALENLGTDIADLVAGSVKGSRQQRSVTRQMEAVADQIADRLEPYLSSEIRGLDEGEIAAAARAAEETLQGALLTTSHLVELNLDKTAIRALMAKESALAVSRNALSGEGSALFELLLNESINYALRIAPELPDFQVVYSSAVLSRETQVIDATEKILSRLPAATVPATWGVGSEDQRFESKYRREIHDYADRLQIFGVTSDGQRSSYSLSVAYISMTVTQNNKPRQEGKGASHYSPENIEGISDLLAEVTDSKKRPPFDDGDPIRVEAALSNQDRIIISGGAGSGKTTLLQWLAVSSAGCTFSGQLEEWNKLVPFIIPLRQYAGRDLPSPESFLDGTVHLLKGAMPTAWVHRVLGEGRGLVLIDGLDEIPGDERDEAQKWLLALLRTFPRNRYVVTSRSAALTKTWMQLEGFVKASLAPMEYADIKAFVSHWYRAAQASNITAAEKEKLELQKKEILIAIRDRTPIRNLCTSPLLCALLCALHRDRDGNLPDNRMDLYATALEMLIVRRDKDRRVRTSSFSLTLSQSQMLLQSFALWLHENGLADASKGDFEQQISRQLGSLHRLEATAEAVSDHLLIRSGVLREPTPGRVDFVHKTFLEYLAAAAIVDENSIQKLVKQAHDDHWREVIVLAAGHATLHAREELIRGLIERGSASPRLRHKLWLLAIACMETAAGLSTNLQRQLEECLNSVIPPNNMTEAVAVASAGSMAIELLKGRSDSAKQTVATVRALSLIGGESAMQALEGYGPDRRITVARELVRGWVAFPAEAYARKVLADSPLNNGEVVVTDPDLLRHLPHLKKIRSVVVDTGGRLDSLDDLPENIPLLKLDASMIPGIVNLEGLSASYPELIGLSLKNCKGLLSDSGAEKLHNLRVVSFKDCLNLSVIDGVSTLNSIAMIDLSGTSVSDTSRLVANNSLRYFDVGNCPLLENLGGVVDAKIVRFGNNPDLKDLSGISAATTIEALYVSGFSSLIEFFSIPASVRRMQIFNDESPVEYSGGAGLESITHFGPVSRGFYSFIMGCELLRDLTFDSADLATVLPQLGRHAALNSITIFGGDGHEDHLPVIPGFSIQSRGFMSIYERSRR